MVQIWTPLLHTSDQNQLPGNLTFRVTAYNTPQQALDRQSSRLILLLTGSTQTSWHSLIATSGSKSKPSAL